MTDPIESARKAVHKEFAHSRGALAEYKLPEPALPNCFIGQDSTMRQVRLDCYTADQLREEVAKAEQRGREDRPACLWNNDDGCWETTCGNAFEINDGTPAENDMTYCCYCGGKIEEDIK